MEVRVYLVHSHCSVEDGVVDFLFAGQAAVAANYEYFGSGAGVNLLLHRIGLVQFQRLDAPLVDLRLQFAEALLGERVSLLDVRQGLH